MTKTVVWCARKGGSLLLLLLLHDMLQIHDHDDDTITLADLIPHLARQEAPGAPLASHRPLTPRLSSLLFFARIA